MEFKHISVLLEETIRELHIKPDGIYVDGTLGGGGHAWEIAGGCLIRDVISGSIRMQTQSRQEAAVSGIWRQGNDRQR